MRAAIFPEENVTIVKKIKRKIKKTTTMQPQVRSSLRRYERATAISRGFAMGLGAYAAFASQQRLSVGDRGAGTYLIGIVHPAAHWCAPPQTGEWSPVCGGAQS